MSTQISIAKDGKISDELYSVSRTEKVDIEFLRKNISEGKIVVLKNNSRNLSRPIAIGNGLRTKVGVEIGLVDKKGSIDIESDKLVVANEAGVDLILDVTTGGYFDEIRNVLINSTMLPYGTIPVFQTAYKNYSEWDVSKITKDNLFSTIERHLNDGVDFLCLNCGLTKSVIKSYEDEKFASIPASKSGILTACAVKETGKENPFYEYFDELLDLVKKYDAVLFLSQGLRTSSIADAYSRAGAMEINISSELAFRAIKAGIQTIIEVGGYMKFDKISSMIKNVKELSGNIPMYSKDVIPTDIALGYETMASSIGYTNAALAGSNLLFASQNFIGKYDSAVLKEGIMSAKIASHCADLVGNVKSQILRNENVTNALKNHDAILYRESLVDGYSSNSEILEKLNNRSNRNPDCFSSIYDKYFKVD